MNSIKCVNFNKNKLVDNLNLVYNATTNITVLWNKFQIFLFDQLRYEDLVNGGQLMHFSELNAAYVMLSSNYLVCLNNNGDVYLSPLKFKQPAQKRIKSSFQKIAENILSIYTIDDTIYILKEDKKHLYFCFHKFASETNILINNIQLTGLQRKKCIFYCHFLCESDFIYLQEVIKTNEAWNKQILVIFSLDNVTLFAFIIDKLHSKTITPIKLFTGPSQISDITLTRGNCLNILVSLASGSLIKLSLNNQYKTPKIMHLNTAVHKFLAIDNTIIYTDGLTVWKAENIFDTNASYRQFKVRYVKDFIKDGNQIICTTYDKLIYLFPIDDDYSYLKPPITSEYCPSEYVINNSICFNKIMEEIEKNNQIIKKIKKEENYLTTLALSNRHDIMDEMINYNIVVYDNYEDILKEGIPLKLADSLQEYFSMDPIYFLLKITTTSNLQQKFSEILSNIFGNLKIHITLVSEQKVLKITSIKILEQLKNLNIVVAFSTQINLSNVSAQIKLVTNVPGALNEKETLWTCLHYKNIQLTPENFIRNTAHTSSNIQFLKEPTKSIDDLIYESTCNHHGLLFKISKISNSFIPLIWPFYVKLPKNYQELLKNKAGLTEKFNPSKANYLHNEISSQEFLRSRNNLCWIISRERAEIEIINDGISDPLLRVTSQNPTVALGIRNFFSNLVHNNFNNYEGEFVNNALYDSVENLEKKMKSCVLNQLPVEEFLHLFEQYQKNIIGALPL